MVDLMCVGWQGCRRTRKAAALKKKLGSPTVGHDDVLLRAKLLDTTSDDALPVLTSTNPAFGGGTTVYGGCDDPATAPERGCDSPGAALERG